MQISILLSSNLPEITNNMTHLHLSKILKKWGFALNILVILLTTPFVANAQMFSMDQPAINRTIPDVGIYAGWEPIQFEYQGDSNGDQSAGTYAFDGSILRVLVETNGVNFHLGTGGDFSGLKDVSYFDAGANLGYGFAVVRSYNINVVIPLRLYSTYTSVTNDDRISINSAEFQQGTLEAGTGANVMIRLAPEFRIRLSAIPHYGLSFSFQQRNAGGSIFGFDGGARLYFDHLFGDAGLSLGYDYNYRQFKIEGQMFDYDAMAHSFLIGMTF